MPDKSRSAENGGVLVVDARRQEFDLVAVNKEHGLLHIFLCRLEDIFAGTRQTAEQEYGLRRCESHEIGQCLAENLARILISGKRDAVAPLGSLSNHERIQLVEWDVAKFAWLVSLAQKNRNRTTYTSSRNISFKTSTATATAQTAVFVDSDVSQFAGKAVMSVNQLAVGNNASAQTRSERYHDEILHALSSAVNHLADCSRIGIIGKIDRKTAELFFHIVDNVQDPLLGSIFALAPLEEVRRIVQNTLVMVGKRSTDTDSDKLVFEVDAAQKQLDTLAQLVDVCGIEIVIRKLFGGNYAFAVHVSVFIDKTECSIDSAYIDTYCEFFHSCISENFSPKIITFFPYNKKIRTKEITFVINIPQYFMNTVEQLGSLAEQYIQSLPFPQQPRQLYSPIEYTLEAGGKRLRPMFVLLCCGIYDDDVTRALPCAAAVEVFHNFTLLHDDIMDNATLRRGRATVHRRWNANTAILSGDAMMIYSYRLLSLAPTDKLPLIMESFNRMAIEVCEGQQYDMDFENAESVNIEQYMNMIRLKTSALFQGAAEIGASLGGASRHDIDTLSSFAEQFGLAFQLQDDLLDSYGDNRLGKNVGGDILEGKKTFLQISAMMHADEHDRNILCSLHKDRDLSDSQKIETALAIYDKYDVKAITERQINFHFEKSVAALDSLDAPQQRKAVLRDFVLGLLGRSK